MRCLGEVGSSLSFLPLDSLLTFAPALGKKEKITKDEANYKGQTKDSQSCSVCTMFITPNACTLVKGAIAPGGWCKYFARKKNSELGKASFMPDADVSTFSFFMPIAKLDKEKRIVYGYASTPAKDSDGEIVTLEAVKAALPDYMQWRNIREMHRLSAVGVAEEANMDSKGLFLSARIVDDSAWQKCVEGVYKGFSIGGRKLDKEGNKITELEMTEISVVDRPANPEASFKLAKSAKTVDAAAAGGFLVKEKPKKTAEQKALQKMAKVIGVLAKEGPRAAKDGLSLPAPGPNASPKDSSVENNKANGEQPCEAHGKINCKDCVEKREFDERKRTELAASGKALPDGSFPIENVKDLENAIQAIGRAKDPVAAKKHIKRQAKALGATDKLPESWGKDKAKKEAKKLAKAKLAKALEIGNESFLYLSKQKPETPTTGSELFTLQKGMGTAGTLSYTFDSLREVQRRLLMEAKREGGDMKDKALANEVGQMAEKLAGIISQKALHEGSEARDLSDVDDQYLITILGEDFDMDKVVSAAGETGDPLVKAIGEMIKRAATPSKAARLAMAKDNVKKSRKACKAARESIEEVHKMIKTSYMAKAAKKAEDKDSGELDHAGMMEKLQKAYGEIEKARTFGKAAETQMEKMAGRAGENGQEAGDADSPFYEVPTGVKDLSPAEMARLSPGGTGSGSAPPLYPADGSVYPGKAAGADLQKYMKDGKIDATVAELLMQKAAQEAELETLRRLPAGRQNGRPYTFDMTKIVAGQGGNSRELNKALFDGVDVAAIGSGNEAAHTAAVAKTAGNYILNPNLGRSLFDGTFRGMAGAKTS